MVVHPDREHFIPLRIADLLDVLCTDRGPGNVQSLDAAGRAAFRRFADAAAAWVHARCQARLQRLKNAYAPFDPDADTLPLRRLDPEERRAALQALFDEIRSLLRQANYIRLSRSDLEQVMQGASDWGVDMDVAWGCFETLEVFVRGKGIGKRYRRKWYRWFQKEAVSVPIFQRVMIALKLQPHRRLGSDAGTHNVFLKLFKDIPQMDVEMLLPGTRLKMPLLERFKLGGSAASSIGYLGWKFNSMFTGGLAAALGSGGLLGLLTLYTPLALLVGYGYRTYATFQTSRQTYMLQLHQSLYYQNLDSNAGVFHRIMDEAEDQDLREVLLAYFYLWRYATERGWGCAELDDYVELDLERRLQLRVDFEIEDAMGKLESVGIVQRVGEGYQAVPIEAATERLLQQAISTVQLSEPAGELFAEEEAAPPPLPPTPAPTP